MMQTSSAQCRVPPSEGRVVFCHRSVVSVVRLQVFACTVLFTVSVTELFAVACVESECARYHVYLG